MKTKPLKALYPREVIPRGSSAAAYLMVGVNVWKTQVVCESRQAQVHSITFVLADSCFTFIIV
jgi:hypothetical protein